jgi:polysaccharide deacetylase family protein (PEP-CTERM system associated)
MSLAPTSEARAPLPETQRGLAIHLEEWFHSRLFAAYVSAGRPEHRLAWAVEPILALLERRGVRATFFVLGDVLRRHPTLVRRLYAQGHEIACYGWRPRPVRDLAPELFAQDLASFDQLAAESLPVAEIVGFRAFGFSLDANTGWALEALRRHGYRYDASMHPARTPWYGAAGVPLAPYRPTPQEPLRDHPEEAFWEFPPTVCQVGGLVLPLAGGLGLRATPLPMLQATLAQVRREGRPASVYLAPWEADPATPIPPRVPLWARAAGRLGTRRTLEKLDALLATWRFGPLREAPDIPLTRDLAR